MPNEGRTARPELVGHVHGRIKDIVEHDPWNLVARPAQGATANGFSIGPESAAACIFKELARLDIHPFVLAAGAKGQDKRDQLLKGELA